jgi:hypothetical protein
MVNVPSKATLRRYGLSEDEWRALLNEQDGCCFVCRRVPTTGRLCIDHEHVRGWKKMPPERRKRYVRGLLCWVCNHYYVGRGISVEKASNVVGYLMRAARKRIEAEAG